MSHSQFHSISSLYLDMHGLIFERCAGTEGGARPTPARRSGEQYYPCPGELSPRPVRAGFLSPTHLSVGTDYILTPGALPVATDI